MPIDDLPQIGLGTYSKDNRGQWTDNVRTALKVGYRHIDTAQVYRNENYIHEGIKTSDVSRDELFLATKTVHHDVPSNSEDIDDAIEGCLNRLNVERVDLLYVHWPSGIYEHEKILPAFNKAYHEGKTRHIGLSNFTPKLINEAQEWLDVPMVAHQVEMHPLLHQEENLKYAQDQDHWLVAYSPLAKGKVFEVPEIQEVARKHEVTPAKVSLAWLLSKDNVAVVPKASSRDHMYDNLDAKNLTLDENDIDLINSIKQELRVVDPKYGPWHW